MPGRFTEEAVRSVHAAVALAERRDDRKVGTEHLLVSVTASGLPTITGLLDGLGLPEGRLLAILEEFDDAALSSLGIETIHLDVTTGPEWVGRRRHRPFTKAAKDTLNGSGEEARLLRHRYLGPEHILLALIRRPPHDVAYRILAASG